MSFPCTGPSTAGQEPGHAWPGAESTSDLLVRSSGADEAAFAQFYDSTCRPLYGLVMGVVRDQAVAEDVTREVYLHVWRNSARFESEVGSIFAWITTFAYQAAVERARWGAAARRA